jgi:dipeptidyl-peptidase 9
MESNYHALSKEEQLRRERMRAASFGITSYSFDSKNCKFLIPAAGSLFVVDAKSEVGVPHELKTEVSGPRLDAKFSPDSHLVAFIRHNDLFVSDSNTAQEQRLTYSNKTNDPNGKFYSGVAEYIMQEEFDRYTGYWWSPQVQNKNYKIAYFEVDESRVHVYKIPQHGIRGEVDDFTYPLAGDVNAECNICTVEFDGSNIETIRPIVKRLRPSLKERFPWMEYAPRCYWNNDGTKVCVQVLDRAQQRLLFMAIDANEFTTNDQPASEDPMHGITILRENRTDIWINTHDLVYFFQDGSHRLIFAEESTGFRHLYMLTPKGSGFDATPITKGDHWLVDDNFLVVDEKRELVYFTGTYDTPLERHLYVVSYKQGADPTKVRRLTTEAHFHEVKMDETSYNQFVSVYSNAKTPYKSHVFRIVHHENDLPTAEIVTELDLLVQQVEPRMFSLNPPEMFNFTSSRGDTVFGCIFKPHDFDPSQQYPCIVKVYGGPHVQLVTNDYKLTRNTPYQMLASLGYVVVSIDGAGSWRRGLKFEGYLRNKMGQIEVQDQVEGVQHLINERKYIDPTRIGVSGWSYGGYLSLMCLAQRPDFFRVAVCGAPVTLWEAYDTGYTERYMDTPQNNPDGYRLGSVLHYVQEIPDEPNRLILAHGIIDENVHVCHTYQLIHEMIKFGKPYQLLVFPDERHGVGRSFDSAHHLETSCTQFIVDNL